MAGNRARIHGRTSVPMLLVSVCVACGPTGGDPIGIDTVLARRESSEHFVFRYAPGDAVDVAHAEAFYAWMSPRLGVELAAPIQYFKFVDRQQKRRLTGYDGNGLAVPEDNLVYTIWPWDNHEVTHILTYSLGAPAALFNEGIAVANSTDPLDGLYTPHWNARPVHDCAKDLLSAGELPRLAGILETDGFRQADDLVTYPTAGSFVEYLTEQYGIETVVRLFPGAHPQDSAAVSAARFQQVFGIALEAAEAAWRAFLQQR